MAEREAVSTATKTPAPTSETQGKQGLTFKRFSTKAGLSPFEEIEWEQRTATIQNEKGEVIFEQRGV